MSELKVGIMKRLLTTAVPGPDRCALAGGAIAKNAGPQSNRNASALAVPNPTRTSTWAETRVPPRRLRESGGRIYGGRYWGAISEVDCNDGSGGRASAARVRHRVGPTPGTV